MTTITISRALFRENYQHAQRDFLKHFSTTTQKVMFWQVGQTVQKRNGAILLEASNH